MEGISSLSPSGISQFIAVSVSVVSFLFVIKLQLLNITIGINGVNRLTEIIATNFLISEFIRWKQYICYPTDGLSGLTGRLFMACCSMI